MIRWTGIENTKDDLCAKYEGVRLDVVHRFDNTWTVYVNNSEVRAGFTSRNEAQTYIEERIKE